MTGERGRGEGPAYDLTMAGGGRDQFLVSLRVGGTK